MKKSALALILMLSILIPAYTGISRDDCAQYLANHERYPWLTWSIHTIISEQCRRNGIERRVILALIDVESAGNRWALSVAGARGLMQVMPFHYLGEAADLYDARINITLGTRIFREYLDLADGNLVLALRNYERGPRGNGYNVNYIARIIGDVMTGI